MTCVVAVVDPDSGEVVIGADSGAVDSDRMEVHRLKGPSVKVFGSRQAVVGYSTSFRLGQIVRYNNLFERSAEQTDLGEFYSTVFVDRLREAIKNEETPIALRESGSIVIGDSGRLFVIAADFAVLEPSDPFCALGWGRMAAYGALFALKGTGLAPREMAERALESAERYSTSVSSPFLFETGDCDDRQSKECQR